MSPASKILGFTVLLLFVLGVSYAGWRIKTSSQMEICQVCNRAIHADMRTVAFVGGKREVFCCPTCALTAGVQMHAAVRFSELTDFESGEPLRPAAAYAVEGSNVVPCVRSHEMLNSEGLPVPKAFDRCSPSIIAFADRVSAERFAAKNGGEVDTFLYLTAHPVLPAMHAAN